MELLYLLFETRTQYKRTGHWRKYKLCCRGFVLALFQSTLAYKIDSEHTRGYKKLFTVCKVKILQVTVNEIIVLSTFGVDFWRFFVQKCQK